MFFLTFLFFQSLGYSQSFNANNYVVTNFGLEEGLPQSSVNDIIQTKDGYIWLATFGGLVRFDGHSFTTFNQANTPGMVSDRILGFFAASDGSIWLHPELASTYLVHFKDGKATPYLLSEKLPEKIDVIEDEKRRIWLQAFKDIYQFDGASFNKVSFSKNPALREEAVNKPASTWFGIKESLYAIVGDSAVQVFEETPQVQSRIVRVYKDPVDEHKLLIGSSTTGITELHLDKKPRVLKTLPVSQYFLSLKFSQDGSQYAISANDVAQRIKDEFVPFYPFEGERGKRIKSILEDSEGNFWIGTGGDGLYRFKKSVITMIDDDDGLWNQKMLSITQLEDGSALFSSNCDGIFEWKDGVAKESRIHKYLEKGCYWSVFQDSKGRIWVGGGKPYMTNSLDEPGRFFTEEDGFPNYGVFSIHEDSKENIWIGTGTGMLVYDGNSFTSITEEDGLYYNDIRTLFEEEDGTFWLGTKAGLNTYKDGVVSKIELVPSDSTSSVPMPQPQIRAIHKDKQGTIWIGTYGNGLFSIRGQNITQITSQDGLFDDIVSHIVPDEGGNFWMGSNRGISRVQIDDLYRFLKGETELVPTHTYGVRDGMNSAETNGGFAPSTFTDQDGNIYFPTVQGVAVVDPSKVANNTISPPVYIERLRSETNELARTETIRLTYDTAFLEINYTGISFTDPERVQFRYKMKGLDDDWIDVGTSRSALYSKIPPGNYTFQVIAGNSDGIWNTEGASQNIIVIPPFWQTTWFYALLGLLIIGAVGLLYYLRVEQLKRQNVRQKRFTEQLIESEENERKRIASELHDSLGQQILVIKNRAELARKFVEKPAELDEQLDEIMQSAVISIADIRTISHGLRPIHLEKFGLTEAVENLCSQVQDASSIEWSYHVDDIDEIVPKEKEINFYRVIQEGINNIFKHAQATEASVIIRRTDPGLKAMIWDNGIGFDPLDKLNAGGLGLSGMNERIETLGGSISLNSSAKEGTTITIVIPIKEWAVS